MIRRRSYNYTDGLDGAGQLDAGLLFISYQNDPRNFIRLQNRLGASDLLNEYIRHIGSAIFAIPPAPDKGHYIGQSLFSRSTSTGPSGLSPRVCSCSAMALPCAVSRMICANSRGASHCT